ncbi:hypothetical protein PAXRUDRAFT_410373 [Paxillus rubicundulus Ve08.2h10]|uniref:SET domain-containing protein n=1 Tax=Paxillus rubicundulus Ve08.2h10 TaxID=930991 RepID=A0A0D0DY05_9AGAM|nr:hypothetical protein PAXRUDRAFT_410373 [Paxillus rubicundulus Ve08.2h10]
MLRYTTGPCSNTRMQCLDSKPLEIKRGEHGLGAFARGDINSGRFIGTYVGQILTTGSADHTAEITKHNSLNYLFEVTPDNDDVQLPIFDAAYIGNATRFLNHKAGNHDNVEAQTLLVNGEHQIGFFTKKKVKAREELFLDYGTKYWNDDATQYLCHNTEHHDK